MTERPYSSWLLENIAIGDRVRLRLGTTSIGRHPSSVIYLKDSTYVSRNHAEISIADDNLVMMIRDLNSINGIFVNGEQLSEAQLNNGDRLGIGVLIENDEDVDTKHPVFMVRYVPLRQPNRVAPEPPPPEILLTQTNEHRTNDGPSTSKAADSVDGPRSSKQVLLNQNLLLSLTDDEKCRQAEEDVSKLVNPRPAVNIAEPPVAMKCEGSGEVSETNTSRQSVVLISDDEDYIEAPSPANAVVEPVPMEITTSNVKESPKIAVVTGNVKLEQFSQPSYIEPSGKTNDVNNQNQDATSTPTTSEHMPINSKIKLERIRSISAEIKSIFGGADEVILDKMKTINPGVYSNLNGCSERPPLLHGTSISLLSDDEENEATSRTSPSLFELNSSKESNGNNGEKNDDAKAEKCAEKVNAAASDEDYNYEPHSEDEDVEELMFSQMIMSDMRAEMASDSSDVEKEEENAAIDIKYIKAEPADEQDSLAKPSIKAELDTSACWLISDDESDKELETKVSGWSNRLFSQSQMNMSQVFEIEDDKEDEDEEEEEEEEECDQMEDNDNSANNAFYNSIDNQEQVIDEVFAALQMKLQPQASAWDNEKIPQTPPPVLSDNEEITKATVSNDDLMPKEQIAIVSHSEAETKKAASEVDSPLLRRRSCSKRLSSTSSEERQDVSKRSGEIRKERQTKKVCKDAKATKVPNEVDSPLVRRHSRSKRLSSTSSGEHLEDMAHNEEQRKEKQTKKPSNECVEERKERALSDGKSKQSKMPADCQVPERGPPLVIEAPSLPRHKGKLRGVSAVQHPSVPTAKDIAIKQTVVRQESYTRDRKRKWVDKPSVEKRRHKEDVKKIKESRKERLKELAGKEQKECEPVKSTKAASNDEEAVPRKRPKVKLTAENRGAFLAKETELPPKPFRIPKVITTERSNSHNDDAASSSREAAAISATNGEKAKPKGQHSFSTDHAVETFSQAISRPDQLLQQRQTSIDSTRPTTSKPKITAAVCKEAIAARAQRTTNKMTFASMERNHYESLQNQLQLQQLRNKPSNLTSSNVSSGAADAPRQKKRVRFNDTPMVRYIERVIGANKRVNQKDIMPMNTYSERRCMVRETFPIVDHTNEIVNMILSWSNEWLRNRNATVDAASDVIFPMPNQFSSFKHYKSILFPLQKLEFTSLLERDYEINRAKRKFNVFLEYVTETECKERFMLVTKFNPKKTGNYDPPKCDLVILSFDQGNAHTFGYLTNTKKFPASYTIVFEIMAKCLDKDFFKAVKEITIRPVVENVRVEFGAFNAVFQVEATPLFSKIIDPLELLKCKPPPKKKINYKGFDLLNDNQLLVLKTAYTKAIQETTPNITLIQGPPGTGKSCVITNLALQLLYGEEVRFLDKKILICAQSNVAIDVIARKLYRITKKMRPETMFRLVRFGMINRMDPEVAAVSTQKIIERHQLRKLKEINQNLPFEDRETLEKEILQTEAYIAEMQTRKDIKNTVEEDKLVEKQRQLQLMRNVRDGSVRHEDENSLYKWYLDSANIVCATLSSCVKLAQYVDYFDVCIIDEATQCTEPSTLMPLKFGINSLILVGDTQQLPATVLSKKATDYGLGNSMFTRIQRCLETAAAITDGHSAQNVIFSLNMQYRMHPEICKWPNSYFYKNELINAPVTLKFNSSLMPFSILNLTYTQNYDCARGQISNSMEATFVAKLLKALDGYIPTKYNSYGLITPYAQHRNALDAAIKALGLSNIVVNTIDSYQGVEKDVIIISNARTHGIGFLANYQRLNVALTRPKKCLILCGNFKNLETVPAWRSLLNNARERKVFHEISESCIDDIHKNVIDKIKLKR